MMDVTIIDDADFIMSREARTDCSTAGGPLLSRRRRLHVRAPGCAIASISNLPATVPTNDDEFVRGLGKRAGRKLTYR